MLKEEAHTAIEAFIAYRSGKYGWSELTTRTTRLELERFFRLTNQAPQRVTESHVREYLRYLKTERNNRHSSLRSRFAHLRSFYKYMVEEEGVAEDPTEEVDLNLIAHTLSEVMGPEDGCAHALFRRFYRRGRAVEGLARTCTQSSKILKRLAEEPCSNGELSLRLQQTPKRVAWLTRFLCREGLVERHPATTTFRIFFWLTKEGRETVGATEDQPELSDQEVRDKQWKRPLLILLSKGQLPVCDIARELGWSKAYTDSLVREFRKEGLIVTVDAGYCRLRMYHGLTGEGYAAIGLEPRPHRHIFALKLGDDERLRGLVRCLGKGEPTLKEIIRRTRLHKHMIGTRLGFLREHGLLDEKLDRSTGVVRYSLTEEARQFAAEAGIH